jgi:GTP cyclohydrolase II
MSILQRLVNLIPKKAVIKHSKVTNISTKFGMFQMQAYKDGEYEYLVMMSRKFFTMENPIVYIHPKSHQCDPYDEQGCGCNSYNQIDIAMKMIYKAGGMIVYYTNQNEEIDSLLLDIKARKLNSKPDSISKATVKYGVNLYKKEYYVLGFILKNLKLSTIQLISDNPNIVEIVQRFGITISKKISTITFDYGESLKRF